MFKSIYFYATLLIAGSLFITSCTKEEDDPEPIEAQTIELLADANPNGTFLLFNFASGETVDTSRWQTNEWDLGLRLTTFIVNSGISGPGNAGVIMQEGIFDEITTAPETGYRVDAMGDLAITDGAWYDYNPVTRSFSPKAGIVFLIRTATGNYAKMEVISAVPTDDNGNVVTPPTIPTRIKYTIRYVYQENGSRNF